MRDIIKTTVPLLLICVVTAIGLSFVNSVTKAPIEQRIKEDSENKMAEVMRDAQRFEAIPDAAAVAGKDSIVSEAYRGIREGKTVGFVFVVAPKGYGGVMNVTVGIDMLGKVLGVKLGDNKETPGLGTKAGEPKFIDQFNLKSISQKIELVKKQPEGNQIQAISGATISSLAVTTAVQSAADCAALLIKKEGAAK